MNLCWQLTAFYSLPVSSRAHVRTAPPQPYIMWDTQKKVPSDQRNHVVISERTGKTYLSFYGYLTVNCLLFITLPSKILSSIHGFYCAHQNATDSWLNCKYFSVNGTAASQEPDLLNIRVEIAAWEMNTYELLPQSFTRLLASVGD